MILWSGERQKRKLHLHVLYNSFKLKKVEELQGKVGSEVIFEWDTKLRYFFEDTTKETVNFILKASMSQGSKNCTT
jgi:hypothetical protein